MVKREEFFRVCNPCFFSSECCVCVACVTLTKNQFPDKIKKIRDDFLDLKEASLEILVKYGGECNHDEVIAAIRKDQSGKATELLIEVASIMSDILKVAEKEGLFSSAETERAKELIGRVNQFLDESVKNCRKTFGEFQEPEFLKETRLTLSSELLKTPSS